MSPEIQEECSEDGASTTPSAGTVKVMSVSGSGKRGRYVRQVTGRHNDTDLHVAARGGDAAAVVRRALGRGRGGRGRRGGGGGARGGAPRGGRGAQPGRGDAARRGRGEGAPRGGGGAAPAPRRRGGGREEQGHIGIVKALLEKDPQLARRNDRKGQTALHMAVKGTNCDVLRALVDADPAIVMLPDKNGNTALHVATRKKRAEIVTVLLLLPDTHVNALNRDHKTAYDIAEGLPVCEESCEIKDILSQHGALRSRELNQPRDELGKTVKEIKKDVHTQLEQTRRTNKNVHGIAKELRKLHREGINNATNSVTVVAVLFATVAFAAIFTVPGGNDDNGLAVVVQNASFKIFFIFNAVALFTSLAVVVVQITVVRGETKSERRVVEVINKLMWLASVCTTISFIASCYIVLGRHFEWAAILVTLIGGVTMAGVLGTMTYYVVKSKRIRKIRKKEKMSRRSGSSSWYDNTELSDTELNQVYAL
ncbi:hypothetical protein PR202_ga09119 [Eleusine coracana subsp. coracana]|uniref:PGG domain-containing protein n=1 Tax=Eleusine coracana subsp. coracana TaxID=191504 RepID=A0AAV5C4E0_ELECO|nr:hypothetical protein PR202_ga09119 [Eleusine coracana subsp. coracana]